MKQSFDNGKDPYKLEDKKDNKIEFPKVTEKKVDEDFKVKAEEEKLDIQKIIVTIKDGKWGYNIEGKIPLEVTRNIISKMKEDFDAQYIQAIAKSTMAEMTQIVNEANKKEVKPVE